MYGILQIPEEIKSRSVDYIFEVTNMKYLRIFSSIPLLNFASWYPRRFLWSQFYAHKNLMKAMKMINSKECVII